MGEPLPKQVLDTAVDPDGIKQQSFDVERRGFDQRQVQAYLTAVAESLRDAQQRETEIRSRLGRAVRRAETAEKALRDTPKHDPAELDRQFAEQVASVLDAARVAGEQRLSAAEKSAAEIMANAKAAATELRAEAEAVLRDRRGEAELAATDIVAEGQAEAQSIRDQARVDGEAMLAQAAARVQRARDECDGLIREAEEARAQILEDMERRRRQARAQVERLRVGRDRLLRSYEVVRRTLEETTVELKSSLKEAKVRGDGAARAITAEPAATREQLEAELRDAKMIGRITISDPGPPSHATASPNSAPRSAALPRPLDPPPAGTDTEAADRMPRRLRVSDAMKKGALASQPKAPAVAPTLTATPSTDQNEPVKDPIAAMIDAAEAKRADTAAPVSADLANSANSADSGVESAGETAGDPDAEPIDAELASLEDDNLDVVEPSDEIEQVVALPAESDDVAAPGLFAALRAQRSKKQLPAGEAKTPEPKPAESKAPEPKAPKPKDTAVSTAVIPGLEAQRDAVIADAAKQLEKRLKRALADEQNELLAGIRASKRKRVVLSTIVGDVDDHVNRYVLAINEVAAVTYGAGAALIDAQAIEGRLPAGAVEELLAIDVVMPIRELLASLDELEIAGSDSHLDPVRSFYRERKTQHLGFAASRLANLLCVAGLCDALPDDAPVPWATTGLPNSVPSQSAQLA